MKIKYLIISTSFLIMLLISSCSLQSPTQTSLPSTANSQTTIPTETSLPPMISPQTTTLDISRFRPLTEEEKDKAVQIALSTQEASYWLQQGFRYTTSIGWVGIVWANSRVSEVAAFDYNAIEKGIPPTIPQSAVVYPWIHLYFGEPPKIDIMAAVDLSTDKVVHSLSFSLKSPPS
jgi:hypothetical protein